MYKNTSVLNNDMFTVEYFLQSNICRLCWSPYAVREILKSAESSEGNTKSELLDKICDCLDISIAIQSGPNKICQTCFDNVECFHSFKTFCKETDIRLREIFKEHNKSTSLLPALESKPVKSEKLDNEIKTLPQNDVIDDFLELLYASDNCSDDNLPLKDLKEKCPLTKVKRKRNVSKRSDSFCTICRIDFKDVEKLSEHNSKSHGVEQNGFKCFGCEKRFRTRRGRMGHEIQFCKSLKDGYKCMECESHLPSRGAYEKHMNKHRKNKSDDTEDTMKCRKCKEVFSSLEDLKRHKEVHSSAKKNFICETCGKVFARHDYLYKHKMTHSGSKAYVCSHCGFRTSQKSSLTVHVRKHTGERPYPCELCPQRCISSSNLLAHRRRHLGVNKYECSICGKKFGYKMSLDEHVASTHDRSQSHVCTLCGAMYSRKRGLRRHMQSKHTKDSKKVEENAQKTEEISEKIQETAVEAVYYKNEMDYFVKYKEDAFVKVSGDMGCGDKNKTFVA